MPETREIVYLNGKLVPAADARLPITDLGVLYGFGFFETFRTAGGHPHHWPYNLRRLQRACAAAGLAVPSHFLAADDRRLREMIARLLRAGNRGDAVFRYTITSGANGIPTEFLSPRSLPRAAPAEGIRLRVLDLPRDNGEFLPRPKSLNYVNALLGCNELARRTTVASDEGLFLSRDRKFVVETPRQNIAWFAGKRLCYPEPSLGPVAGTCLDWILEQGGFAARPVHLPLGAVLGADAVFVCNAVRGITPVREIWDAGDRAMLGAFASATHPQVRELRSKWDASLRATAAS